MRCCDLIETCSYTPFVFIVFETEEEYNEAIIKLRDDAKSLGLGDDIYVSILE